MAHKFEPGDVAMARRGNHNWHPAMFVDSNNGEWWCYHGMPCEPDEVRPLVVIDPEDREQVERLVIAFSDQPQWYADTQRQRSDAMQAALREFANPTPPKPEEPTGLGAVVEAIYDNRFVRVGSAGWVHVDDHGGNVCDWEDIAVVRVLSEGLS